MIDRQQTTLDSWADVYENKDKLISPAQFSNMLIQSLRDIQLMSPMDLGVMLAMYNKFHTNGYFAGTDSALVRTVGETFTRGVSAICDSLSLVDLFELYIEILAFSRVRQDLDMSICFFETALLRRVRVGENLSLDFPFMSYIDVFRESLDEEVLNQLSVHLLACAKEIDRNQLAQQIVALDSVYESLKVLPSRSLVECVKAFVF